MTAERLDTGRDRRWWVPLVLVVLLVVGFFGVSYVMSHLVFGYVTCDAGPPPPPAFDVVESSGGGCWTYKMPWPEWVR